MKSRKCPLCNGQGKIKPEKLKQFKNDQKELRKLRRDIERITQKQNIDVEKKISDVIAKERERNRKKYEPQIIEAQSKVDKLAKQLKKARKEKKPATEIGKDYVETFKERLKEIYENTEDKIEAPENSRPDILHTIIENGKVLGRFVYELKCRKFQNNDTTQLKNTIRDFNADGGMIVAKEMPKRFNGSHIQTVNNTIVSQFHTAVPLSAIFREQFIRIRTFGKGQREAFEYIQKFIAKRGDFLNIVNEIGNSTTKMLEEEEAFFDRCKKHFETNKDLLNADKENVKKLKSAINGIPKIPKMEVVKI